jgi:single-stranded-DNA-specific exonuclease
MIKGRRFLLKKNIPKKIVNGIKDVNPLVLQLLYNRGVFLKSNSLKTIKNRVLDFLNPDYENLYNPFLMKDMDKAVARIKKAIGNKEKIIIFGDYDADGVTSSSVLYETLKFLGAEPVVYIPHREKEGYGLNKEAIEKFKKQKINLVITVDCGIRNKKEIYYARKLNIDVIVTDHHEPGDNDIPTKATALINPKQKDCKYPFKMLAGVGVAFKLAQALISDLIDDKGGKTFLKWLLDFVAIGSIGDMVPLIDENRIMVNFGHIVFEKSRRPGIVEMKKNSRNNSARFIDFFVAPRINAAGRMDHALWAFNLLTTQSKVESFKILKKIESLNDKRKNLTEEIVSEAKKEIMPVLPEEKFIFVYKKGWSAAVSGIVSNRLVDEFGIPSFVSADNGILSKGSARSPKGVDLTKLLKDASPYFEKIGGHKNAAGFTYKIVNRGKIIKSISKASEQLRLKDSGVVLEIDSEITLSQINNQVLKELLKMSPFGEGNSQPIFLAKDLNIVFKNIVGKNHLKLMVEKDGYKREAIGFNKLQLSLDIDKGDVVDIIFRLGENEYRGVKSVQIEIIDIIKNEI